MKLKHNKKRNTIFIFESLVRELTKSVINKDFSRKKEILSIIKENFGNTTVLGKELEYYKSILESKDLKKGFAEKLLQEVKRRLGSHIHFSVCCISFFLLKSLIQHKPSSIPN